MDCWWTHYSDSLPHGLSVDDKAKIEYFTGRMPHLLRGLLKFSGRQYLEIKKEYTTSDFYFKFTSAVKSRFAINLHEYAEDEDKTKIQMYVHSLLNIVCEGTNFDLKIIRSYESLHTRDCPFLLVSCCSRR